MKLANMTLTDQVSSHEIAGHANDRHEIAGQDMNRLKIDNITTQCAILFKTMAEHKSQQQSIICICIIC